MPTASSLSWLRRLSSALVVCSLPAVALAQCSDWAGGGCPTLADLVVSDPGNTPIALPPGHDPEVPICPASVNENKRLQLDVTETYSTIDAGGLLYVRSFYNVQSAASTTRQFWFFDLDRDALTGGSDAVFPDYVNTGPAASQGPAACSTPACSLPTMTMVHPSGFEAYIMSFGQGALDFALFLWNGAAWVEQPQPAGAVNLQSAEDNPYNDYPSNNGYRGIAYLPASAVGINGQAFRMFTRSWSCAVCCGDEDGGEAVVPLPGMRRCELTMCGDCDGSNAVNIVDALRAAHYACGLAELEGNLFANCNVVGALDPSYESDVSILDALRIARSIVGLDTLDCCDP